MVRNITKTNRDMGFSLLEVVIMVMVLVLLIGLIAPAARNMIVEAKASKVAELADFLRDAAMRYHLDTDKYAVEISGTPATPNWSVPSHRLSMKPNSGTVPGWNGPYLEKPVSLSHHPEGDYIAMHAQLTRNGFQGFDLQDDGMIYREAGNMLVLQGVDEDLAAAIDRTFDSGMNPAKWRTVGRVCYNRDAQEIYIYLYGGKPVQATGMTGGAMGGGAGGLSGN